MYLFWCQLTEGYNNDPVPCTAEPGGCAIQFHLSGTPLSLDGICFQACAGADVVNLNLLEFTDSRCVHDVFINGQGTGIVEIGTGEGRLVNFSFQKLAIHMSLPWRNRTRALYRKGWLWQIEIKGEVGISKAGWLGPGSVSLHEPSESGFYQELAVPDNRVTAQKDLFHLSGQFHTGIRVVIHVHMTGTV